MEPRSDADLVELYRETANPAHFEELVRRHHRRVLDLVHSVLGPELGSDAEDVAQRIFLRVHDRLASFRGRSAFGTWLHRVGFNLAVDHKRRRLRRRRLFRERVPDSHTEEVAPAPGLSTEHALSVRRALRDMPEPYQTALRLRYWLDLPVADVAERLGVAEGTARSYLHRGRARLNDILKERDLSP